MAPTAQVAVMASIVATLLYLPAGLLLALASWALGIPVEFVATFRGVFNIFVGLALWWVLVFAGACVYAACLFPWGEKVREWPRKT
jgi:hypothetical protein